MRFSSLRSKAGKSVDEDTICLLWLPQGERGRWLILLPPFVKEMFPVMCDALLLTLEEVLKQEMPSSLKESWRIVYNALSNDMIRAQAKTIRRASSKA